MYTVKVHISGKITKLANTMVRSIVSKSRVSLLAFYATEIKPRRKGNSSSREFPFVNCTLDPGIDMSTSLSNE